MTEHKLINILLNADGGTEGAGTVTEGTVDSTTDVQAEETTLQQEAPQYDKPKYFAQMNKEKADSEDYKGLYKYQKIDELADAYLAQGKEMEALKDKYKNSIAVPERGDLEGIRKFQEALGIPETAEGYKLNSLKDSGLGDETLKTIKDSLHGAMLSDKQAEAVGNALLKVAKIEGEREIAARANAAKTFDTTLAASYADIANEADRKSTAERDKASYERFANESGLKEFLDKHALSYNATFVKAVAQYARKHTGSAPQGNLPTTPTSTERAEPGKAPAGFYGGAFNEVYGK